MAEEKKKLVDFDLDDLLNSFEDNVKKDVKDFSDIINLSCDLEREIVIGDIFEGMGKSVDGLIRFWNRYDEAHNIPVEERKPIKLMVDSGGGSLLDSLAIIDSVKLSKTPVHAIITGAAYSGGFFISISASKRSAYKHASFLFHEGSAGNGGTSGQFENFAAFYKKQLQSLKEIVLENTKITEEEYEKIKRDDVWYDAYEALEKGIIDEVL